jgi:hypothetical protein
MLNIEDTYSSSGVYALENCVGAFGVRNGDERVSSAGRFGREGIIRVMA